MTYYSKNRWWEKPSLLQQDYAETATSSCRKDGKSLSPDRFCHDVCHLCILYVVISRYDVTANTGLFSIWNHHKYLSSFLFIWISMLRVSGVRIQDARITGEVVRRAMRHPFYFFILILGYFILGDGLMTMMKRPHVVVELRHTDMDTCLIWCDQPDIMWGSAECQLADSGATCLKAASWLRGDLS